MRNPFWIIVMPTFLAYAMVSALQTPPCGVKGSGKNTKDQISDSLKNRSVSSDKINSKITLTGMLKRGDDTKRWKQSDYAKITGYVLDVKYGGWESCNCYSKDKKDFDIHIEIVKGLAPKYIADSNIVVVEINRFVRASDKSLDYDAVRKLKNKKVEIEGWLFADVEHKQNSYNTNPKGTNVYRATLWELHPLISIKETK